MVSSSKAVVRGSRPRRGTSAVARAAFRAAGNIAGRVIKKKITGYFTRKPKPTTHKKLAVQVTPVAHADMTLKYIDLQGPVKIPKYLKFSSRSRACMTESFAQTSTVNIGSQGVALGRYVFHRNQFLNAVNSNENSRDYSNVNPFELNPNQKNTGSVLFTTPLLDPSTAVLSNDAVFVKGWKSSISITSFSNVACHVDVYWLVARKNSDLAPDAAWSFMNVAYAAGQSVYTQPTTTAGQPTGGYLDYGAYGSKPSDNPEFKKYWTIMEKRVFILPSGNTMRFETKRRVNKVVRRANLQGLGNMIGGLTMIPMVIVRPAPVQVKLTAESNWNVNTASTKFSIMQWDTCIYKFIDAADRPMNRAFLSNISVASTGAVQQLIDEEDKVVTEVDAGQ
nr:putative capsid protein [Cressdnaviricota sp.]